MILDKPKNSYSLAVLLLIENYMAGVNPVTYMKDNFHKFSWRLRDVAAKHPTPQQFDKSYFVLADCQFFTVGTFLSFTGINCNPSSWLRSLKLVAIYRVFQFPVKQIPNSHVRVKHLRNVVNIYTITRNFNMGYINSNRVLNVNLRVNLKSQ